MLKTIQVGWFTTELLWKGKKTCFETCEQLDSVTCHLPSPCTLFSYPRRVTAFQRLHKFYMTAATRKKGGMWSYTLYINIYIKKDFQHNLKKIYIYNTWKLVISSMKTARYSPTRTALIYFKMKTFIALDTRFKNWKYQWILPSFIGHKIYISESVKWYNVNF